MAVGIKFYYIFVFKKIIFKKKKVGLASLGGDGMHSNKNYQPDSFQNIELF